jgi:uncharacterized protein YggU (UPF0235/DUF167 family)
LLGSRRVLRRCGAIWTDHGRFRVVPTGFLLPFAMPRQDIIDALQPGRCYELRWFGYEADPARGGPMNLSNQRTANTIYGLVPRDDGDCGVLPASLAPPRPVFWEAVSDGLLLHLRVDFAGPSDAVLGLASTDDGPILHLRIAGAPGGNAGNAALLAFIGHELGLPPSSLRVVSGQSARRTSVLVQGILDELIPRLATLVF